MHHFLIGIAFGIGIGNPKIMLLNYLKLAIRLLKFIDFSPSAEFTRVMDHIANKMVEQKKQ